MWPAFPASAAGRHSCDYYGSSVPPRRHQPATGLPTGQQAAGRLGGLAGWFPRSLFAVGRGRRPTMPLQHRHTYAAGLRCGLPADDTDRRGSCPHRDADTRCNPAQIRQIRAGGYLEGRSRWFLAYAFPSCLPDPCHLTVLTRPVVAGAACRPHPRSRDRAAPSFTSLLRQASRDVLSPSHGQRAPRGARCHRSRSGSGRSPPSPGTAGGPTGPDAAVA